MANLERDYVDPAIFFWAIVRLVVWTAAVPGGLVNILPLAHPLDFSLSLHFDAPLALCVSHGSLDLVRLWSELDLFMGSPSVIPPR